MRFIPEAWKESSSKILPAYPACTGGEISSILASSRGYLISLFARASNSGGIVSPICLAKYIVTRRDSATETRRQNLAACLADCRRQQPLCSAYPEPRRWDKTIRMGRISRVNGLSMKPRVSSVTAPSSAPSCSSPNTTGDVAAAPRISNRHSETPRSIGVPCASVNSTWRSGLSRSSRQVFSGSTE